MMDHKAGFVNIIGKPNVGKSTLMNLLVGEKLAIITSKAQTTRHRILGIVNKPDYQIIFSDLPGILQPNYKLQEKMMQFVDVALKDADIFIYMVEAGDRKFQEVIVGKILKSKIPVVILINKIDLSQQDKVMEEITFWQKIFPGHPVIPISAANAFNIEKVNQTILGFLPVSPPYYPKDELTDRNLRFFTSEIIREKILLQFRQEIPYSVEVVVESFKESEEIDHIAANIFVTRESQKMIILGKGGKAIKKLGIESRNDIEEFLGKKVFLELTVKVNKDWRNNERQLKRFGYEI